MLGAAPLVAIAIIFGEEFVGSAVADVWGGYRFGRGAVLVGHGMPSFIEPTAI